MEFLELDVGLPFPVLGLISEPHDATSRVLVLHVHGYGADHYSNSFVRAQHAAMPKLGVAFASIALPTSGYIMEQYSDRQVRYVGSALVHPEETLDYVQRVVQAFRGKGRHLVLQGHSFGTNIVKEIATRSADLANGYIFLSAADSVALQRDYVGKKSEPLVGTGHHANDLVWEAFGISTEDRAYPIPIMWGLFVELLNSAVFTTWTDPSLEHIHAPRLFIRCRDDSARTCVNPTQLSAPLTSVAATK